MQWSLFEKIVNGFMPLSISTKKLLHRCLIGSGYVTALWVDSHWVGICNSHWWKPNFKNVSYIVVVCLLLTGDRLYKNEIQIKEFIISPSFIFTKDELLYRFFKVLCLSCRTPILRNISRTLLLKETGENSETYLSLCFGRQRDRTCFVFCI